VSVEICFVSICIGEMNGDIVPLEGQKPALRYAGAKDAPLDLKAVVAHPASTSSSDAEPGLRGQVEAAIETQRCWEILGAVTRFAAARCEHPRRFFASQLRGDRCYLNLNPAVALPGPRQQ